MKNLPLIALVVTSGGAAMARFKTEMGMDVSHTLTVFYIILGVTTNAALDRCSWIENELDRCSTRFRVYWTNRTIRGI